jgi:hypothetical protein
MTDGTSLHIGMLIWFAANTARVLENSGYCSYMLQRIGEVESRSRHWYNSYLRWGVEVRYRSADISDVEWSSSIKAKDRPIGKVSLAFSMRLFGEVEREVANPEPGQDKMVSRREHRDLRVYCLVRDNVSMLPALLYEIGRLEHWIKQQEEQNKTLTSAHHNWQWNAEIRSLRRFVIVTPDIRQADVLKAEGIYLVKYQPS